MTNKRCKNSREEVGKTHSDFQKFPAQVNEFIVKEAGKDWINMRFLRKLFYND